MIYDETASEIMELRADLPRLTVALRTRETLPSAAGVVSGGAPSWELISLEIDALLTDIRAGVDELDAALRAALGHNYHRRPQLGDALLSLATAHNAAARLANPPQSVHETAKQAAAWRRRSRRLLGEAWAPYPLKTPDGTRVRCPVIYWAGAAPAQCAGELYVHRDDATAIPNAITCRADPRSHRWPSGPAWLRLGALLVPTH